jgi:hypothetical protein
MGASVAFAAAARAAAVAEVVLKPGGMKGAAVARSPGGPPLATGEGATKEAWEGPVGAVGFASQVELTGRSACTAASASFASSCQILCWPEMRWGTLSVRGRVAMKT